jgi:hypothetical protein
VSTFAIHGLIATVEAPPDVASVVRSRLLAFESPAAAGEPDLRMRWHDCRAPSGRSGLVRPEGAGRTVYERPEGSATWWDEPATLWLEEPALRARCLPGDGTLDVDLLGADGHALWLATHGALTLSLVELFRHRQLYNVHASSVETSRGHLLVAGTSGAGKTTLALALARSGLPLLGDDMSFLRPSGPGRQGIAVHAFPDEVDVTEHTVLLLPWLEEHVSDLPPGWPKWPLRPEELGGPPSSLVAPPAALVFPQVTGNQVTSCEPLDAQAALDELLPNLLLTARDVVQAHVAALWALASSVPCYRVHTGRDPAEAAARVRAVVGV